MSSSVLDCVYMTDARQEQIQKDLLWDYIQGRMKAATFQARFDALALKFEDVAKRLREKPEGLASTDFSDMRAVFDEIKTGATEYKSLFNEQTRREKSLKEIGIRL